MTAEFIVSTDRQTDMQVYTFTYSRTGHLNSGKDDARAQRKQLTKKSLKLSDDIEAIIKKVDALKGK